MCIRNSMFTVHYIHSLFPVTRTPKYPIPRTISGSVKIPSPSRKPYLLIGIGGGTLRKPYKFIGLLEDYTADSN